MLIYCVKLDHALYSINYGTTACGQCYVRILYPLWFDDVIYGLAFVPLKQAGVIP